MSPSTILMLVLAASPLATYGVMAVKQSLAVNAAVAKAEAIGVEACDAHIRDIAQKMQVAAAEQIAIARKAADDVTPTPAAKPELVALCQKSSSCRDRGTK